MLINYQPWDQFNLCKRKLSLSLLLGFNTIIFICAYRTGIWTFINFSLVWHMAKSGENKIRKIAPNYEEGSVVVDQKLSSRF